MVKRRAARELALKILYAADVGRADAAREFGYAGHSEYLGKTLSAETIAFGQLLVDGVLAQRKAIDQRLRELAREWTLSRMASVDRNILRLAAYEMLNLPDIPYSVSINEAVELAKAYGGDESGRFVNGILGNLVRGLPPRAEAEDAPSREAGDGAPEGAETRADPGKDAAPRPLG